MSKILKGFIPAFLVSLCFNVLLALPILAQGLNIHKDTLTARQLLNLEKEEYAEGQYQQAIETIQKAQVLYHKHALWDQAIKCAIRSSEIADRLGLPKAKSKYANAALYLAQQHLPNHHILLASAFRQKAEAMMMNTLPDSANYYLDKAVPIFRNHQAWVDLGWSEVLLGVNYLNQYQLDSCANHLQIVQNILQKKVLTTSEQINIQSTLFNLRGILYDFQGDYDKAIQNTKQAIASYTQKAQKSAIDSSLIASFHNNLGTFYFTKGDYRRALDNFIAGISINKLSSSGPSILNNIAESFSVLNDYPKAIQYFQQSLALTKSQSTDMKARMNTLVGLGISHRESKNYKNAISYLQQAIDLPLDYRKYTAWAALGNVFIQQKQAKLALQNLNLATKAYLKDSTALNSSPFFLSRLYRLTGDAYFLNKDYEAALKAYQEALIINHKTFDDSLNVIANPPLTNIHDLIYFLEAIRGKAKTLATINLKIKQQELALTTYQLTIQWIDSLQRNYTTETSQLDWSSVFKPIYEEAIGVAYQLYQSTNDPKYIELAFSFSEKSKNAILLNNLKSNEGKLQAGVPEDLIQQEKDLNIDIAFYQKALRKAKEKKEADKVKLYQNYLSETRLALANLQEKLELDYPKFQAWKHGGQAMAITDIQATLLEPTTAFLEYFIGDQTSFVFFITKNSMDLFALTDPDQINASVILFRKALLDFESFNTNPKNAFTNYQEKATKVFQQLLKKPLSTTSKTIDQLIIVPDGLLNTIPFEALTKGTTTAPNINFAALPYLLYDYQIAYAYSANLLSKNKRRQQQLPANTKCLALAPTYQGQASIAQNGNLQQLRDLGTLKGTAEEIQHIATYFNGQFDFGSTANERQFKEVADQFGILHLAMHGTVDLDNPSFNHLRFPDLKQDSTEDNLLYHYEIANMDLQAQLVVLSACETGVGKYEKGEGVFSLARSFMYAGAPSVVMSLWKVNDLSTSRLMPYFYKNLADGKHKDAALHQAKTQFLKDSNLEYRHPFYWSSFVVLGDTQGLYNKSSSYLWWGFGGLFLLLISSFIFFWSKKS